jgi:hypothetical protein
LLLDTLPIPVESKGLRVVDKDTLDGTNANRCVLAVPRDEGEAKVDVVAARIDCSRLGLEPVSAWWEEFTTEPAWSDERNFRLVVSCVDKYEARRAVQLEPIPQLVLTTGTGDFLLTVSRHHLDIGRSCALCYQPRQRQGPGCGQASDGAQATFEGPAEPSIGFVSLLAGIFLGAELAQGDRARLARRARRKHASLSGPPPPRQGLRAGQGRRVRLRFALCGSAYREVWGS